MLDVSCDYCGKPLTEPGALMFSPPDPRTRQCTKIHICAPCWHSVEGWAEKTESGVNLSFPRILPGDFDHVGIDLWTRGTDDGSALERVQAAIDALRANAAGSGNGGDDA